MQQNTLFPSLMTEVQASPVLCAHVPHRFQADGCPALFPGIMVTIKEELFGVSLVFALSPLLVIMLEYFRLQASDVV